MADTMPSDAPPTYGTHIVTDGLPKIESNLLASLVDYWLARVKDGAIPKRTDIDAIDIPKVLPCIWLQEDVDGEGEFVNRLAGEEIRKMYPVNVIGVPCREIVGPHGWKLLQAQYLLAFERPGIGHSRGPVYMHTIGRSGIGERVFMPLRDKTGTPKYILGATVYTPDLDEEDTGGEAVRSFCPLECV